VPSKAEVERFARVPLAAIYDPVLQKHAKAKLVLDVLCAHADSRNIAWPKLSTIARLARIDRRNLPRHVKLLEDLGYLRRIRTHRGRGYGVNRYRILFPPHLDKKPTVSDDVTHLTVVAHDDTQIHGVVPDDDTSTRPMSSRKTRDCRHPRRTPRTDHLTKKIVEVQPPCPARPMPRSKAERALHPSARYAEAINKHPRNPKFLPVAELIARLIELIGAEEAHSQIISALQPDVDPMTELPNCIQAAEADSDLRTQSSRIKK
jgi:hypothetical protein